MLIRIFLIVFTALAIVPQAKAQDGNYYTVRDFEVWSAAKFKYKINKDWSIGLEQQLRLKDDASTIDQYFSELELKRNLGKHFTAAFAGRYIRNNDTKGGKQGYENHFRWNTDLAYDHDINRFNLKYRLRYQARNEMAVEDISQKTIRFKFESEYNIKKWQLDPVFSAEIFNGLTGNEGFNKIRFTLGTEYKTKKMGEISTFYRMEKELIGVYPKTTNILGIGYQYTLKNKKK